MHYENQVRKAVVQEQEWTAALQSSCSQTGP